MLKKEVLIEAQPQLNANIGEDIGYELGAKMIKDYFDKFEEGGSHFIGKNILEKMLAQPGCIGIKIYKALNEKGNKTYVFTGIDETGKPILDITAVNEIGELKTENGIVADRVKDVGWFDFER